MDKANPTGTGSFSLNRKANTIIGARSFAEGYLNEASGTQSHAEGTNTTASGNSSHAEGTNTTTSGNSSHAEGNNTTASGNASHAEGYNTTASGNMSHAEGSGTTASESYSHAEGYTTTASGNRSHAEGTYTEAKGDNQHVSGKYNIVDNNNTYAEIIGNGTSNDNRSNSRTLDWNGNETLAGDLTFSGNKSLTSEISRLDGRIDSKANASDVYTKSQTDNLLSDKADADNTYTQEQVDNIVSDAIYNILPSELTPTGAVASFETALELPLKSVDVENTATKITHCGANICNQADIVDVYPSKYTVDTDGSIKTVGNLTPGDVLWTNTKGITGTLNIVFVSKYQNAGSVGIRPKIIYTDATNSVLYPTNTQDYSTRTLLTSSGKTVDKIVVDYGTNNPTNFYLEVTPDTSATIFETYNGTEYPISEKDNIIALNGANNVFADNGDISVEYKVSIEDYVEKRIANVQALILNG